ncbi:hypothetical protein ABIC03_002177 [Bradyrhizobium sp. RT6a]
MDQPIAIDLAVEAWKMRALSRLARPSMLMAQCTEVLVVWTGSRWSWIGEAGQARLKIASTSV